MFRLRDRQLYTILGILALAVAVFCGIALYGSDAEKTIISKPERMRDFSEGWIATYGKKDADKQDTSVTEVVQLPTTVPAIPGKKISLMHKAPDIPNGTTYLLLYTDRQAIQVSAGNTILYRCEGKACLFPRYHIVALSQDERDSNIVIEVIGQDRKTRELAPIREGSLNELMVELARQDGYSVVLSGILLVLGVWMWIQWGMLPNKAERKRLLGLGGLECIVTAVWLGAGSSIWGVWLHNAYATYLLAVCLTPVTAIVHCIVMRTYMNRKRILAVLDVTVLGIGIACISGMVLNMFALVSLPLLFRIGWWIYGLCCLEGGAFYVWNRALSHQKAECLPLAASGLLTVGVAGYGILCAAPVELVQPVGILCAGIGFYSILQAFYAQRQALQRPQQLDPKQLHRQIQEETLHRMHPEVVFAAFQTLQTLLKQGSANGMKMLYYISVYFRGNWKALENAEELVPFEEELAHMIAYLQLQRTRNAGLQFTMECKVKDFEVPRHSLEPMVENAVVHGIGGRGGRGNIAIRSYMRAEGYTVQIIDDGAGFNTAQLKKQDGDGLLHLFARLEQQCDAQTEVVSKKDKGTVITVILPAQNV